MKNIIEINNLNKYYGEFHAVKDLSFRVKEGELFAFLGENGAGKSTTISIICGVLDKDSGDVVIDGNDATTDFEKISKTIGVVFQNSVLDSSLSVKDNLLSRASLYGISGNDAKKRISELSEILEFENILNRQLSKLSGGQKRKIDIARALLHKPKILILDEPTTGLDPQTRKKLWEVIEDYRKNEKMTVFLTTHYMEEAAEADYIVILDSGEICAEGTPLELKNKYVGDYITVYNTDLEKIEKLGLKYEVIRDAYKIEVENTKVARDLIIKYPEIFTDFEITKGKMDDVFLNVTGKKLGGGER